MNPLFWIPIGGGAAAGILLIARRARAAEAAIPPAPAPLPLPSAGESPVSVPMPAGWRRVSSSEVQALPELSAQASALRNTSGFTSMQYGTLAPFIASDGKTYATWIEQHYHEPGGAVKPYGYHHGVTLLAKSSNTLSDEWGLGQSPQNWYIWWVDRAGGGQWYGWKLVSDEDLWRLEADIQQGTPGVIRLYRWLWDGQTWQYDTRNAISLYVRAGEQKLAAGW